MSGQGPLPLSALWKVQKQVRINSFYSQLFLSLFFLLPNFRVGEWAEGRGGVFGRGDWQGFFYFLLPALFPDIAVNHLSVKAGM